jgi:hypothetical protein
VPGLKTGPTDLVLLRSVARTAADSASAQDLAAYGLVLIVASLAIAQAAAQAACCCQRQRKICRPGLQAGYRYGPRIRARKAGGRQDFEGYPGLRGNIDQGLPHGSENP